MKVVKLSDLPIIWMRGAGLRKSDISENGEKYCVLYGELFTKYKGITIEKNKLSKTSNTGSVLSKAGDVLVPGTSTAAKSEMIRARAIGLDGVLIGGDINIIRPPKGIFDNKYLAYFFETLSAQQQLNKYITGTTGIIHISNSGIKNMLIPLVSLDKQRQIVKELDTAFEKIHRAIELTRSNIQNTQHMRRQIIESEMYISALHISTLGEFCSFENGDRGKNYPSKSKQTSSGVPFINAGHLNDFHVNFDAMNYISEDTFQKLGGGKVKPGDILFCLRGSLGKFATVGELNKGAIASSLVIIRPDYSKALAKYLLYYFEGNQSQKMIQKFENGAAQPNLSAGNLKKFQIHLPDLSTQQSIVKKLESLTESTDRLYKFYVKKADSLLLLKQSLLRQAFDEGEVE